MSKRLEQMRRNPRGDWSMRDVKAVCDEGRHSMRAAEIGRFALQNLPHDNG
ncbi:hypothetical protein [Mesorhizobium sp. CA4]|uniref:hypothetical protein n=1 Tax=Mesorhizobium sp. CA4 TaxID=588499 RepID=UPI001CD05386|nr:hypothetical protein [Mesorhizobium sp. CA4]MBZ9823022.1 hypothetical protein [Mesorhizobium sp. CA4]